MMSGPPENMNYGPDGNGGDFKRYNGNNYAENDFGQNGPQTIYRPSLFQVNLSRQMAAQNPAMHMQQYNEEQQYAHGQPGGPNNGPGIFGGPPIHMGPNGSAMMVPPPPSGMPHHPGAQQPPQQFLVWDGQQYHAPTHSPRPANSVTPTMSSTTAVSSGYEQDANNQQPMGMPPQQFVQQQHHFQQVVYFQPGMPPMFPPQSPNQQQFMVPNGPPPPPQPLFMPNPNGPVYFQGPPGSYGAPFVPAPQGHFLLQPQTVMVRQQDGSIVPMLMRPPQPQPQMHPADPHFQRPQMMYSMPQQGMMERGGPGMPPYMAPMNGGGPPAVGSVAYNSLKSRGQNRVGKFIGQRGTRARNIQTPSSVTSEPQSESTRSDGLNTSPEEMSDKFCAMRLDSSDSSPEIPVLMEVTRSDKQRKPPTKQMLQLASGVKEREKQNNSPPAEPTPAAAAVVVQEEKKKEEDEERPTDPVVSKQQPQEEVKETVKKAAAVAEGKVCTFCRSQGMSVEEYTGHVLREGNKLACEVARQKMTCSFCKQVGGDDAHTIASCPKKKNQQPAKEQPAVSSAPREFPHEPRAQYTREGSVDSRASAASSRQQYQSSNRGGAGGGFHKGGGQDHRKSYNNRGRRGNPNYGRGGSGGRGGGGGGSGSHYQGPPRK